MNRPLIVPALLAASTLLAGCVTNPPYAYNEGYAPPPTQGSYYRRDRYLCSNCGNITRVERVYLNQPNTGLGAVIGAIAGGVLGSTIGHGRGRTATTVAGAVAGGFAGNAVEESNRNGGVAWRFYIQLDDGRSAVVTQYDRGPFRTGDHVVIAGDHLEYTR